MNTKQRFNTLIVSTGEGGKGGVFGWGLICSIDPLGNHKGKSVLKIKLSSAT